VRVLWYFFAIPIVSRLFVFISNAMLCHYLQPTRADSPFAHPEFTVPVQT
jgi:hypothetical protein